MFSLVFLGEGLHTLGWIAVDQKDGKLRSVGFAARPDRRRLPAGTLKRQLDALQALENQAGRERPYPNAPRTLDLDLLMYGQARMQSPRLTLPHPRWRERAFVMYPLADLRPDWVSPDDIARVSCQSIDVLPELTP